MGFSEDIGRQREIDDEVNQEKSKEPEKPKYELQNPDWEETKKWESDVVDELREIMGERGEWPFDIKYDKDGNLERVLVNGIQEGRGKLGGILKDQAVEYYDQREKENQRLGNRSVPKRDDKFLLDAYKADPEVRDILDKGIAKVQELNKIRGEFRRNIIDRKVEEYKTSDGLNEFLGRLGIAEKAPEFNLDELVKQIENCSDEDLPALATAYGRLLSKILGLFDEYKFSKEQETDLRPDELALWEIGSLLRKAVSSRAFKNSHDMNNEFEESMRITRLFSDEVAKSSTGSNYEYSPAVHHSVFRRNR